LIFLQMAEALEESERTAVMDIYQRYKKYILAIALDIVKNQQDAEDILNDVMIKIMKNIHNFMNSDGNKIESQIVIYTRSTAIDYYRRNKKELERRATLTFINEDGEAEETDIAAEDNTEEVVLSAENAEKMKKLLLSLPRKSQYIIELICLHNYSYKEVGVVLDASPNSVATGYMRIKRKLRKMLEEESYDFQ